MKLLTAVTTNGPGTAQVVLGTTMFTYSTVFAWGTWDGATVTLEMSPDEGTTWIALTDLTFTENAAINMDIAVGIHIRGTVSGVGTSSVNLSAR